MNLGDFVKLDWEPEVLNPRLLNDDSTNPHKNYVFFLPFSLSASFFNEMNLCFTILVSSDCLDDFRVFLSSESLDDLMVLGDCTVD